MQTSRPQQRVLLYTSCDHRTKGACSIQADTHLADTLGFISLYDGKADYLINKSQHPRNTAGAGFLSVNKCGRSVSQTKAAAPSECSSLFCALYGQIQYEFNRKLQNIQRVHGGGLAVEIDIGIALALFCQFFTGQQVSVQ